MDLSTMLAQWRAGNLRGPIPRGLLGYLERAARSKEERIRESRTLTPEAKRLEANEARREFRQQWTAMRGQVLEQFDRDLETAKRTANPPASEAELTRMGLLANVYLKSWERAAGNMNKAADEFAVQGDRAGLRLLREHAGLAPMGARQGLLKRVGEAEEVLMTDAQRTAANQVRSLEGNVGVMKAVDNFPSDFAQELKTPERVRALRRELVGVFDSVEDFRRRIVRQTVLPFNGMWHAYAGRGALGC